MLRKLAQQVFRFKWFTRGKSKTINTSFQRRNIINPISKERIQYIEQRTKVIEACIQTGFSHMQVLPPGGQRNDMQTAIASFNTERMALQIEHHVLTTTFQNMLGDKPE